MMTGALDWYAYLTQTLSGAVVARQDAAVWVASAARFV